jgi:hypothetical protein
MPDLSPAAQAVLDAFDKQPFKKADGDLNVEGALAAALRAAADQANPKLHIEDIDYQHQSYVDGWNDSLDLICAIATELVQ